LARALISICRNVGRPLPVGESTQNNVLYHYVTCIQRFKGDNIVPLQNGRMKIC